MSGFLKFFRWGGVATRSALLPQHAIVDPGTGLLIVDPVTNYSILDSE